jgi:carbon starvation protein
MSAIILMATALCFFALAYRYYSAFIAVKALMLDDRNVTPAVSCNDGNVGLTLISNRGLQEIEYGA